MKLKDKQFWSDVDAVSKQMGKTPVAYDKTTKEITYSDGSKKAYTDRKTGKLIEPTKMLKRYGLI